MARKKQDEELQRHPQVDEEINEEIEDTEVVEETSEVSDDNYSEDEEDETSENDEDEDNDDEDETSENDEDEDNDDEDDSEGDEDEDKEMTKSEARDYVEDEIDDKFMDDCSKPKMTPERAKKKIAELKEDNQNLDKRINEISAISKIASLDVLRDFVKDATIKSVSLINADEDVKENAKAAKDGIKGLESIGYVEQLIRAVRYEKSNKEEQIKSNEREIERIKNMGFQLDLFENQEPEKVETEVEETNAENAEKVEEVEQPTLAE